MLFFIFLKCFILFLFSSLIKFSSSSASPIIITSIISQTTTTFVTPEPETKIHFITVTEPTQVIFVTKTATPSTSTFVAVTVVNVNQGKDLKHFRFLVSSSN